MKTLSINTKTDPKRGHRKVGLGLLVCITLIATSCEAPTVPAAPVPSPIKFADKPILPLPAFFRERNRVNDAGGQYKYHPDQLVGRILIQKAGDSGFRFTRVVLKAGFKPEIEVISEDAGQIYDAIIDSQAALGATYLAAALDLSGTALAEVHIQDRVISRVENTEIPLQALLAETSISTTSPITVYWVQGVLVTSIDYVRAFEVDLQADAKLTEAFGANARVYNKTEAKSYDYTISVDLLDLRELQEFANDPVIQSMTGKIAQGDTISQSNNLANLLSKLKPKSLAIQISKT